MGTTYGQQTGKSSNAKRKNMVFSFLLLLSSLVLYEAANYECPINDKKWSGYDVSTISTINWQSCENECCVVEYCDAWTYDDYGYCHLKDDIDDIHPIDDNGSKSGGKCCLSSATDQDSTTEHRPTNPNEARYLERIGVQIGNNGCNCYMKLTICPTGPDGLCCTTEYLDSSHNDFASGDYDIFQGSTLGECDQFQIVDHPIKSMQVHHEGSDGVKIEYWEVFYGNGMTERCDDHYFYDGDEARIISCS